MIRRGVHEDLMPILEITKNCAVEMDSMGIYQWNENYPNRNAFIDDIKKNHGGDVVFFAMTVDDYELMGFNTQEIRRYINQLGEVIVYYRNVTINDDEGGAIEIKVEKNGNN